MSRLIKVGSRDSKLALVQTQWVIDEIRKKHPEYEFEIVKIKTKGDKILDTRLDKIGGKGLFIKELEHALIHGEVDMAVHSMKDMPARIPEELSIDIVSKREDPRDVLVKLDDTPLSSLKDGSIIGTSSLRREMQILQKNNTLKIKTLRGNVLTRLSKLLAREYDAIILASAGLKRLGIIDNYSVEYIDEEIIIPAVGQGVLCIETRKGEDASFLLDSIHNTKAYLEVKAERAFMIRLDGGCSVPIAAHAKINGDKLKINGMYSPENTNKIFRDSIEGNKDDAEELGKELADKILDRINRKEAKGFEEA